jgi:hypothetical protein
MMMVQGGGRIDPSSSASTAPTTTEQDVTNDPRVRKAFGQTGFFCPFYTFGVDELAPGKTEAEDTRPVLLYLPGACMRAIVTRLVVLD